MKMENWITELLTNLDDSVDEKTKQNILEKCGTKCPFSHMPDTKLLELRNEAKTILTHRAIERVIVSGLSEWFEKKLVTRNSIL